ncbi:2-oxoglutarate dehydrogenase E1 component [Coemansia spiralis]|nr:2-oxoglutarate dehydrogenase E1 component [Coemansia spiralis]
MFRALADQVDGTSDTHARHRESVCEYMARHADEFAPFMDETCPFDRYVSNMQKAGVYGGNLELVAFARNYRVDIRVYQVGGRVFVISGASPDNPSDPNRSMPAVHIAYHSYEHYSSVRNKGGPHSGLPNVKASAKENRFFSNILNGSVEQPVVMEVGDLRVLMQEAMLPKIEPSCDSGDGAGAGPAGESDDAAPSPREKLVIGSTGVDNLRLVRRLLQEHDHDESAVIELLIQWMAESQPGSDDWWSEDGPADYNGSRCAEQPADAGSESGIDASVAAADDGGTAGTACEPEAPDAAMDTIDQGPARPARHFKGAARQRKAESKKRRKEMSKLKKRQAASAGDDTATAASGSGDGKAGEMNVIFI